MARPARLVAGLLGSILVCAPLSIVATLLLFPLWSWLEASTGIESVGHSGPAEWCYLAVFLVLSASAALAFLIRRLRGRRGAETGGGGEDPSRGS